MNNALLYLGAFFALVLGALFAVPTFIDWNGYRGVFEEQASKVLGRDVRVGGTVNVRFLPAPYVKFEKLRIADMADASGEALFRAESFKLWLSVPPLLRGVFEANQIELKRPVLRLAADKSGGGNWSTLTFAAGNLPFVPNDVTLEQVSVINGSVSLNGSEGVELARIDGINGDLTSETLLGPFKFKGTAKWDGGLRDVRIATAAPEANGDVRFKANVTVAGTKHAYTLDGRVADLKSKPRVEAELTAKLTLANAVAAPAMAQSAADPSKSAPTATSAATAAGFDLRGKVTGDTSGFKCDDIALSLDQAGPPQIVTGAAKMAWTDKVRLDLALQSSWLDLDRATAGTTARPLEVARGLFDTFAGLLPVEAETNVGLNLDQVNFGGEAVSGVRLAVVRAGGPLELKEFRAGVPGGTTVVLDGVLDVASRPAAFQGNASLDGQRMFKFLAWALKRPQLADDRPDQSFSLSGRLMLGEKAVELKAATATIGEQPLKGEMSLVDDVRRRLGLTIEGARIDLGQLFPGSLSLASLAALKTTAADGARTAPASSSAPGTETAKEPASPADPKSPANAVTTPTTAPAAADALFDPARSDIRLRLTAGELSDGDRVLKDVDIAATVDGERLTIDMLTFSTADGLAVDVSGDADNVRIQPKGALRGVIASGSRSAVATLFKLMDVADIPPAMAERLSGLTPFRLAGTVSFGQRLPAAIDIDADGIADGARLVSRLHIDAARKQWTDAPVELTTSIDGASAAAFAAGLVHGHRGAQTAARQAALSTDPAASPRRLSLKASGTPSKGLVSVLSFGGNGASLDYSGRVTIPATGETTAAGTLSITGGDAREALALIGLPLGAGMSGVSIAGDGEITLAGPTFTLVPRRLMIGDSAVTGKLTTRSEGERTVALAAELEVDRATLPRLLAPMVAAAPPQSAIEPAPVAPTPLPPPQQSRRRQPAPAEQPPAASAVLTPGIWPEQVFDLSALDRLTGTVRLRFKSLVLDEGLTIADAVLAATLEPQAIRVTSLEGTALGGRLASDLTFERAAAGVGLTGRLQIGPGEPVAAASGAGAAQTEPTIASSLTLDFAGRALSPAALVTSLSGKGKLALGDVTLTGMGPAPVASTAELALQGKGPAAGEPLAEALKAALKQGQMRLGALEIPVTIIDGAMKFDRVSLETTEGRSAFDTAVELASMKVDSEWKIEARIKGKGGDAATGTVLLPPVSVVYSGKLKDFATLEPAVETGALERELTVRKMERDVEELERLRKLDQSKAREEQERQKALEAERLKAAAERSDAPAPPVSSGGAQSENATPADQGDGSPVEAAGAGGATTDSGVSATTTEATESGEAEPATAKPTAPRRPRPPPPAINKRPPPGWKPFQITPF